MAFLKKQDKRLSERINGLSLADGIDDDQKSELELSAEKVGISKL